MAHNLHREGEDYGRWQYEPLPFFVKLIMT
nr:MAG TPA: hypothetical protein [Caudoviricetes sp.]DAS15655.1 MAG TPA: hypothetical protein [Caudoviricetes sp.]